MSNIYTQHHNLPITNNKNGNQRISRASSHFSIRDNEYMRAQRSKSMTNIHLNSPPLPKKLSIISNATPTTTNTTSRLTPDPISDIVEGIFYISYDDHGRILERHDSTKSKDRFTNRLIEMQESCHCTSECHNCLNRVYTSGHIAYEEEGKAKEFHHVSDEILLYFEQNLSANLKKFKKHRASLKRLGYDHNKIAAFIIKYSSDNLNKLGAVGHDYKKIMDTLIAANLKEEDRINTILQEGPNTLVNISKHGLKLLNFLSPERGLHLCRTRDDETLNALITCWYTLEALQFYQDKTMIDLAEENAETLINITNNAAGLQKIGLDLDSIIKFVREFSDGNERDLKVVENVAKIGPIFKEFKLDDVAQLIILIVSQKPATLENLAVHGSGLAEFVNLETAIDLSGTKDNDTLGALIKCWRKLSELKFHKNKTMMDLAEENAKTLINIEKNAAGLKNTGLNLEKIIKRCKEKELKFVETVAKIGPIFNEIGLYQPDEVIYTLLNERPEVLKNISNFGLKIKNLKLSPAQPTPDQIIELCDKENPNTLKNIVDFGQELMKIWRNFDKVKNLAKTEERAFLEKIVKFYPRFKAIEADEKSIIAIIKTANTAELYILLDFYAKFKGLELDGNEMVRFVGKQKTYNQIKKGAEYLLALQEMDFNKNERTNIFLSENETVLNNIIRFGQHIKTYGKNNTEMVKIIKQNNKPEDLIKRINTLAKNYNNSHK